MQKNRDITYSGVSRLLITLILLGIATGGSAMAEPKPKLSVSCAPERPVVYSGESIEINIWVTDAEGKPLLRAADYIWKVSEGVLTGTDNPTWKFSDRSLQVTGLSIASAKVTVTAPEVGSDTCIVRVFLEKLRASHLGGNEPTSRSLRLSGRGLLPTNQNPPNGYGLYSYLLFDRPPRDDIERGSYLKALEAYLLMLQPIEELEHYQRRSNLNLLLVPVKKDLELTNEVSDIKQLGVVAEQVLANYDYSRASALLAMIGEPPLQGGPLMVAMKPAAADSAAVYLFLDMSRVTPKLVSDWIKAFCRLAAQTPSWGEVEVTKLALNTRNAIAVAARDTPEVLGALQQWIRVFKPGEQG
jgi:hypothetical protein